MSALCWQNSGALSLVIQITANSQTGNASCARDQVMMYIWLPLALSWNTVIVQSFSMVFSVLIFQYHTSFRIPLHWQTIYLPRTLGDVESAFSAVEVQLRFSACKRNLQAWATSWFSEIFPPDSLERLCFQALSCSQTVNGWQILNIQIDDQDISFISQLTQKNSPPGLLINRKYFKSESSFTFHLLGSGYSPFRRFTRVTLSTFCLLWSHSFRRQWWWLWQKLPAIML